MENNDKLYQCADSYTGLCDYEYRICLYNNGTIINRTIGFDDSGFMHLAGLEKLTDLTAFSDTSSRRLYDNITNRSVHIRTLAVVLIGILRLTTLKKWCYIYS